MHSVPRRRWPFALLMLAATAFSSPLLRAQLTTPAGWTPAWSDEFNGTAVDTNRWNVLTRQDSYNNEKQYYTPNAVKVNGGNLNITAIKQPLGTKQYQSGLIRTKTQQQFGRVEVRASLPTGQGMWPAIWLLPPDSVPWPTGGEIDIMENRGSAPTIVGSAYHYGTDAGAGHRYVSRDFSYTTAAGTPISFQNSMHTYGVEWDQSRIRYLIDGVPSYTFYRNTAPISVQPMDLIINLAVGGDFGGDPNSSTLFPQTMSVDYVHVFDRDPTTRGLNNNSFEARSGTLFQEWDEYGNGTNVLPDSVSANAHSGSTAVQMYGRFNGADNTSGLYQEVAVTPGEVWQVGAFSQNRPGDKLAGSNEGRIKIEFIDQNGAILESAILKVADLNSPTSYRESVLRRVAPANAKYARAVLEMRQLNNATGAVNFDDASLRLVSGSSQAGDVNLDGVRDAADLDALNHSISSVNGSFDYTNDSSVNASDVDALLASAFATVRGDIDLNHRVDFTDLLTLAKNYDTLGTGHWSSGDFNGDANVNFDDLLTLAKNYGYGQANSADAAAHVQADWALAQALVPEPASMSTILVGVAGFARLGLARGRRPNDCVNITSHAAPRGDVHQGGARLISCN